MDPTIVTITTDFGTRDSFVAAMKGVILSINRQVTIVDISNHIPKYDIASASYFLASVHKLFPYDTIHIVVVDPGVGTSRSPIAIASPYGRFICPDNGVVSHVLKGDGAVVDPERPSRIKPVRLPEGWEARKLTNRKYFRADVSNTFHGRDIFAPVAGHLSLGVPISEFGEPLHVVSALPIPEPLRQNNTIVGSIQHVDRFGNLISNISAAMFLGTDPSKLLVHVGSEVVNGLSKTYATDEGVICLINSEGLLEVAVYRDNASARLGVKTGDSIEICLNPGR